MGAKRGEDTNGAKKKRSRHIRLGIVIGSYI